MPPISYMQLLKKKEQGKGLYDPKNSRTVEAFHKALGRTILTLNKEGKGKVNTRKLTEFQDQLHKVMRRDPATKEEYTEEERKQKLWHPERPLRPRQHVNRNSIEDAVCELTELGDFLGKSVPGEYTNAYDYILQYADPADEDVIRKGLEIVNDTLELGMPLEKLEKGQPYASTAEEKQERREYKAAVKEGQENREANRKEFEEEQRQAERKRQKASREADQREAREIEEKSRKQREEEEKRRAEEKRRQEEAKKSDEQKQKEAAERREKARQDNLKNREAMRASMEQSIKRSREADAAPDYRKINMAMAAAFHAELDRVGADGDAPIDQERVKRDMENFYNSAAFAKAEAEGTLDALAKKEPGELRGLIGESEREASQYYREGSEQSLERVGKLWEQFNASWRVKKNSAQFEKAKEAMRRISDKGKPATRGEHFAAGETVKAYVAKNINKAESDAGKKRMAISLAFLKQTMTKDAFEAYCNNLNVQRGLKPTVGKDGKLHFDVTDKRCIDPKAIGTVDEVYNETKERLALVSQGKAELEPRDLAMMTALTALREKGGGDKAVEQSALQAEIEKVEKDSRFREALKNDSPETLIGKAWTGQLNTLEGYARPAQKENVAQI